MALILVSSFFILSGCSIKADAFGYKIDYELKAAPKSLKKARKDVNKRKGRKIYNPTTGTYHYKDK